MVHWNGPHRHDRFSIRRLARQCQQRARHSAPTHSLAHTSQGTDDYVTEGMGRIGRRGGPVEHILPGDRVVFEPGEDHWNGPAPTRFMTHLSLVEVDAEGNSATWGAQATDEEYRSEAE